MDTDFCGGIAYRNAWKRGDQLHCHTFWQVIAGAANGFLWVYLLT